MRWIDQKKADSGDKPRSWEGHGWSSIIVALARSVLDHIELSEFYTFNQENQHFDIDFNYNQEFNLTLTLEPIAGQYLIYSEGDLVARWHINLDDDRTNYTENKMFFLVKLLNILDELIYDWYLTIITSNETDLDKEEFLLNLDVSIQPTKKES